MRSDLGLRGARSRRWLAQAHRPRWRGHRLPHRPEGASCGEGRLAFRAYVTRALGRLGPARRAGQDDGSAFEGSWLGPMPTNRPPRQRRRGRRRSTSAFAHGRRRRVSERVRERCGAPAGVGAVARRVLSTSRYCKRPEAWSDTRRRSRRRNENSGPAMLFAMKLAAQRKPSSSTTIGGTLPAGVRSRTSPTVAAPTNGCMATRLDARISATTASCRRWSTVEAERKGSPPRRDQTEEDLAQGEKYEAEGPTWRLPKPKQV